MITLTKLPQQARYWQVEQLIDYCLDEGYEGIINNRVYVRPYQEYSLRDLLNNPYIWDKLKVLI